MNKRQQERFVAAVERALEWRRRYPAGMDDYTISWAEAEAAYDTAKDDGAVFVDIDAEHMKAIYPGEPGFDEAKAAHDAEMKKLGLYAN